MEYGESKINIFYAIGIYYTSMTFSFLFLFVFFFFIYMSIFTFGFCFFFFVQMNSIELHNSGCIRELLAIAITFNQFKLYVLQKDVGAIWPDSYTTRSARPNSLIYNIEIWKPKKNSWSSCLFKTKYNNALNLSLKKSFGHADQINRLIELKQILPFDLFFCCCCAKLLTKVLKYSNNKHEKEK